jgi:hypothetical protein
LKEKKIILISSEAWGDVFVSKHHYASFLSEQNEVYFINPPSLPWRLKSLFRVPVQIREIHKGLRVIDYGNPLPLMARLPFSLQKFAQALVIAAIMKKIRLKKADLVWSFDLKRFYNLQNWPADKRLFHAVELIDHPFFIRDAPYRHQVLKSADFVISIADIITAQASIWNANVKQINHGIDISKFNSFEKSVDLPGKGKIKAGFVGNFQVSFDFGLLKQLANENPDVDFIMIGPKNISNLGELDTKVVENIEATEKQENIYFLGKVKSDDLPAYLKAIDINLVIYGDEFTEGHCNPHKLMSYFYFGKVTVSSYIDQYKKEPELIQMVRFNRDLPSLFSKVLRNLESFNSPELQKKRYQFAQKHDYKILIDRISQHINGDD